MPSLSELQSQRWQFAGPSWVSRKQEGWGRVQERVRVEALASTRIPIDFGLAAATNVDNQTVLTYSATNRTTGQMSSIQVMALIVDSSGYIKGGEGWIDSVDLPARTTQSFSVVLKNRAASEDRLLLVAWQATGTEGTFEMDVTQLMQSVRPHVAAGNRAFSNMQHVNVANERANYRRNALKPQTDFCGAGATVAQATCRCGVSSFSCTATSYSFTCFSSNGSDSFCI